MGTSPRPSFVTTTYGRVPLDAIRRVEKPQVLSSFATTTQWCVPVAILPTAGPPDRAFIGPFDFVSEAVEWIARWFPEAEFVDAGEPRPVCGREVVLREVEGHAAEIVVCTSTGLVCPWARADGSLVGLRIGPDDQCAARDRCAQ